MDEFVAGYEDGETVIHIVPIPLREDWGDDEPFINDDNFNWGDWEPIPPPST